MNSHEKRIDFELCRGIVIEVTAYVACGSAAGCDVSSGMSSVAEVDYWERSMTANIKAVATRMKRALRKAHREPPDLSWL